jgi:hypothetical protein
MYKTYTVAETKPPVWMSSSTLRAVVPWKGAPDQAEALLNKMRLDYLNGNDKAQLDAIMFEIDLQSWTNNHDVDRVEHDLRQMWTLHDTQLLTRFDASLRP